MSSVFSKIVRNEIPSFKIHENDNFLAFLDINPLKRGHTLVIPKKEVDYIFDIATEEYLQLWEFTQVISKAMKKVISCKRISIVVIGLDVPHAHIHLIPIDNVSEINFNSPKIPLSNEEMNKIANQISSAI